MTKLQSFSQYAASPRRIAILRNLAYAVGTICFALSAIYVVLAIKDNWQAVVSARWRGDIALWMPLLFAGYAASLLTTALSWPAILSNLARPLPLKVALQLGLLAQVGKYMPGNVAHIFGRAALAKRHNIDLSLSGVSTIVELGSAVIAAFLVAFAGLIFSPAMRHSLDRTLPEAFFGSAMAIVIAAAIIGAVILISRPRSPMLSALLKVRLWVAPVCWLACSFLLAGISFYALGNAIFGPSEVDILSATSIYAAAWAVGFLIPGSPAGLGVREAVLLGLLTPLVGSADALLFTLSHRLMTAVTDGTVAAIAGFFYFKGDARNG
jgi:glycosyltransferase 2 family protein